MLSHIIQQFPGQKIMVLGDLMLDEYLWGDAKRISPEAPVQVIDIHRESIAPGGACNVAANISSLGGKAFLGGIVGRDAAAVRLRNELTKLDIDDSGLIEDDSRPTITKTRLVARNQQIVRYDREYRTPLDESQQLLLLDWVRNTLPKVTICIFSDYAKGLSSPAFMEKFIGLSNQAGKPVIVDPKGNGFQKYLGSMMITPNLQEAEIAVGQEIRTNDDLLSASQALRRRLPGTHFLIKQGSAGMTLFLSNGESKHVDAEARQVFDVTGAGDTVIAALAMSLCAGAGLPEAASLANRAAGIVVAKIGTATTTSRELELNEALN